jgi:tyrosyl-tRNA synthetase
MRLPDSLTAQYLRVYTLMPLDEIDRLETAVVAGELNPMQAKRILGRALVERYHGGEAAAAEDGWFTQVFSRRSIPDDVAVVVVSVADAALLDILRECLPGTSASELRRLIRSGGVRLNGTQPLTDPDQRAISSGDVIRVGKRRWFRIEESATCPDS